MLLGFGVLLMSVVAGTIVAINRGTRRFGLGMLLGTGIGMMLDLVMCGPLGFDLSPR
ncbi:hypothetical protein [Actinoplanes sp. NPDC049681]|uniref:hypothetical protein n=1 Tax=Actinoplanes sp. NPDC049681 TaxID=3363905 RepID=UPI0037BB9413